MTSGCQPSLLPRHDVDNGMHGHWQFTLEGRKHTVTADITMAFPLSKLTVTFDGERVCHDSKALFLGTMHTFHRLGHHFRVRIDGYGLLGKFRLDLDGKGVDSSAPNTQPPPLPEPHYEMRLVDISRVTEPLGQVSRKIDNSQSSSRLTRTITLTQTWKKTVLIEQERTTTLGGGIDFKLPYAIGIKASAERKIRDHYAITHEEEREYKEEVMISVEPAKHLVVVFDWKQVWECGFVSATDDLGQETRVPYRVQLAPTFDQSQRDHVDEGRSAEMVAPSSETGNRSKARSEKRNP